MINSACPSGPPFQYTAASLTVLVEGLVIALPFVSAENTVDLSCNVVPVFKCVHVVVVVVVVAHGVRHLLIHLDHTLILF